MPNQSPLRCPLCDGLETAFFHRDRLREYHRCGVCGLVFVPSPYFLSPDQEKACYDQHENDPADDRYRQFLGRLSRPLIERLRPGAQGLDFGSGPGPTLSVMLAESGHPTEIYDPFYAPDETRLHQTYDFITASEVVEHLHRPREILWKLWSNLRPGGWLGIMTKRVKSREAFATWHYKNDPTHVAFFAADTFQWLAMQWQARLEIVGADVVLLQKPAGDAGASSCSSVPSS